MAGNLGVRTFSWDVRPRENTWGFLQSLDESFMSQESRKVLDTPDLHFANFEEQIEKLSGGQRQAVAIARNRPTTWVWWNSARCST